MVGMVSPQHPIMPSSPPWASLIRPVPDFPQPGITFRDVMPLLADGEALGRVTDGLASPWRSGGNGPVVGAVAGIEARGFIFGSAVALELGVGFVPLRKSGRLPPPTVGADYELEYGTDRLEVSADLLPEGTHVLLVDDVLATGGTAVAAASLLRQCGVEIVGSAFVVELPQLAGRRRLAEVGLSVASLCSF